jgi:hypothetical protein
MMQKKQFIGVGLVLLVAASSLAGPKIYCTEPSLDFGERSNSGKITHDFVIENRGNEPLLFGKRKNCCGMTVDFPFKSLAPGSNAVCKATFSLAGRRGKQVKEIYIASNDRKKPYLTLKMQGTLNEALEITPRYIRFNPAETMTAKTVRLTSTAGDAFSITNLSCKVDGFQVTKQRISDLEWKLTIQPEPGFAGGKVRGRIELQTDHPGKSKVYISLSGEIAADVRVSPLEVVLKSGGESVTRHVALRAQEPFKILSTDLKNCDGTIEQTELGKTGWSCALKLNPSTIQPNATFTLTTDNPRSPILTIPIRLVE